jgi:hypothetical protein
MTLHFGLAVLGTLLFGWSPAVALALHLLAAVSYALDATRRGYLLRRLLPSVRSRNLLAVRQAVGQRRLRLVLVGHIDAAFTGTAFHPAVIRAGTKESRWRALRFLRKSMLVAVGATLLAALLDVLALVVGPAPWLWALLALMSLPAFLVFAGNLEIVLRNQVVPGACDNLTGCAAVAVLAERLRDFRPDDLELVYVVTGAEEAGTGGASALARAMASSWEPGETVVLGLDTLSNGELRLLQEGEMLPEPLPAWLAALVTDVAASAPRWGAVPTYQIPSGATDALPFLRRGYDAACLGCIDPEIGAPRHYHRLTDTPDNVDLAQLALSIDFAEALVRALPERRLGLATAGL